jgi:histidine kinase/histidine kinase/DNA gyrase B/HSP90-like ATPase
MSTPAFALSGRSVAWVMRARGLLTGIGYAIVLVIFLNVGFGLEEELDDIGSVSIAAGLRNMLHNFLIEGWPPLPSVVVAVVGVNLAPRAGVRRITWLVCLVLLLTVWDHAVRDPRFHERAWPAHMFLHFFAIALIVSVCAYHSNIQSNADMLLRAEIGRATLDAELKRAHLQLLRAQIEPHFLFNTLTAVRALGRTDRAATVAMLDNLIRYFEAALPRLRQDRARLAEEMQLIDSYLGIYRVRMGSRLSYEVKLPDSLASVSIPTMMLLTLVENALKHGINPVIEGGFIKVSASRQGEALLLKVADSGRGMSVRHGRGIGLANVRQRLVLLYGDAAYLSLAHAEPRGVVATISIPCVEAP